LDCNYIGPFKRKLKEDSTREAVTSEEIEVPENADWMQNVQKSNSVNQQQLLQEIRNCGVVDERAGPIVSAADRFFELGVYFHSPFSLKGWSKEVPMSGGSFCVLCGDSGEFLEFCEAFPPSMTEGSLSNIFTHKFSDTQTLTFFHPTFQFFLIAPLSPSLSSSSIYSSCDATFLGTRSESSSSRCVQPSFEDP
jgi:hypothetical protein